jgi:hypothetical protein
MSFYVRVSKNWRRGDGTSAGEPTSSSADFPDRRGSTHEKHGFMYSMYPYYLHEETQLFSLDSSNQCSPMSTFPKLTKIYPLPRSQRQLPPRNRYTHTRPCQHRLNMCRLQRQYNPQNKGGEHHVITSLCIVSVICLFWREFVECVNHVFADVRVPVSIVSKRIFLRGEGEETHLRLSLRRCVG